MKGISDDLEDNKYQQSEPRISIYGRCRCLSRAIRYLLFRSIDEWSKLAAWFTEHKVFSHTVRYLIQVHELIQP